MKRYITTAVAGFGAGAVLSLTEAQAGTRAHNLQPLKTPGLYRVVNRVEFKAGEEIGVDGEANKALLSVLADPESPAKAKRPREAKPEHPAAATVQPLAEGASAGTDGDDLPPVT